MRLDHVSYATTPDHLADVVQRLGSRLGGAFSDGGLHPRFGTRNFVLPLAGGAYVEVVAALDHPAAERAPFGQAVQERAARGGGWLGWVVAVDDITPLEDRLGRPAVDGHRVRPDGHDLRWKQIGVNDLRADPYLPFFTCWTEVGDDHPSTGGADVRLVSLGLSGDAARLSDWIGQPPEHLLDDVDVEWVGDEPPGLCSVGFSTSHGPVSID